MAKAPGVEAYQVGITLLVRTTKPSGPPPAGQIRVRYWLRLKHDIDADNTMKIINDALAVGLGVDDRVFLPCVHEKSTGHLRPEVAVEIEW